MNLDKLIENYRCSLKRHTKITAYLMQRGISPKVITQFRIGFCDKLVKGLDWRFSKRIVFPIFDFYGNAIALAGRSAKKKPKFLNTPYSKTSHLYGLNFAKYSIIKENKVFIVEGYFDVATLHSKGIKNVVAVQGSYLHKEQAFLLNRLCDNIVYIGDGDVKVLDLQEFGFFDSVRSIVMPVGYDPDKYVLKHGKDKFFQYVDNFEIERLRSRIGGMA